MGAARSVSYVLGGELKALSVNATPHFGGVSGCERTGTNAYIELIFTFCRPFGWGMQQITGYVKDCWGSRGLDVAVPSFGQLGENVSLLIDGTGLSFVRTARWYEETCGRKATHRQWRELNIVIEADMNNHNVAVTGTEVSDSEGIDRLMAANDIPAERVIDNGVYSNIVLGETLSQTGIVSVIPPPANAVVHGGDDARWSKRRSRASSDASVACVLTRRTASQESEGSLSPTS